MRFDFLGGIINSKLSFFSHPQKTKAPPGGSLVKQGCHRKIQPKMIVVPRLLHHYIPMCVIKIWFNVALIG